MKLHIDKKNEITAHEQLREQIIFHISTGELAIGQEMPSVRALARQLDISLNTVSGVYSELVRGGWLVDRAGAHHTVVERKDNIQLLTPGNDLDDLIDRIISLAQSRGHSLQQLAERLRHRLLGQPADHFLIVEPDPGIGEIMREEIRTAIGYAPPTCGLRALQQNPALGIGALLISPTYMVEKLGQRASDGRRILPISYSPMDALIHAIARISQPSMLGWVSNSGAGLKTMSGIAAPISGNRHSNHLFLMKRLDPEHASHFRLRRYGVGEYHPLDIMKAHKEDSGPSSSSLASDAMHDTSDVVTTADLRCMDLLFCDTIAFQIIDHPKKFHYRLLSDDSLKRIKAEAHALPKSGKSTSGLAAFQKGPSH